jgi:hypothetical protein
MGMNVKGLREHRLVAEALSKLFTSMKVTAIVLGEPNHANLRVVQQLQKRADLGIARCKARKPARVRRQNA